jgi:hypothetical protein
MTAPWLTAADVAETELVAWHLSGCIWTHRQECAVCSAGLPYCEPVKEAIEAALDWKRGRDLRSRALFLRALQNRREAA